MGGLVPLLQILEEHFTENVPVSSVTRKVGLSTSRFEHLFKHHVGCGVMRWLRIRRCREALNLLEHTDLRIYEVAEKIGFSDSAYFCRIFRREYSQSPTQYRTQTHLPVKV